MSQKIFTNVPGSRKFILRLLIIYLAMAAIILSISAFWASKETDKSVKSEMKRILSEFTTKVELISERNSIDAKNLALNNTIRAPLMMGLSDQIREYCTSLLSGSYSNLKNLVVLDSGGNTVFSSNSSLFRQNIPSGLNMENRSYTTYLKGDSIYKLYYFPIMYDNNLVGAIVYISDTMEFSQLMLDSVKEKKYDFYGISSDKVVFMSNIDKVKKVDFRLNSEIPGNIESKSVSLNINGTNNTLSFQPIKDINGKLQGMICLGISNKEFMDIKLHTILFAMLAGLAAVVFFIVASILLIKLSQSFIYRNLQTKLQIQNLRVQKHDFLKHLNIINGLIKSGESDTLKNYIDELNENLVVQSEIGKTGRTAVSVLIQQKEALARKNSISFSIRCDIDLSLISVNDNDLCTLLGNLLDNALEASQEANIKEKAVMLEISYESDFLVIKVSNKGNQIKEKDVQKIFKYGYTTKKDSINHGAGLYIVTKILRKYGGGIEVGHMNSVTTFTLYIPHVLTEKPVTVKYK